MCSYAPASRAAIGSSLAWARAARVQRDGSRHAPTAVGRRSGAGGRLLGHAEDGDLGELPLQHCLAKPGITEVEHVELGVAGDDDVTTPLRARLLQQPVRDGTRRPPGVACEGFVVMESDGVARQVLADISLITA